MKLHTPTAVALISTGKARIVVLYANGMMPAMPMFVRNMKAGIKWANRSPCDKIRIEPIKPQVYSKVIVF